MNGAPITKATLTPLVSPGRYRIEAAGITIESRYPENRMTKVLALAGVTGKLEVFGPSADGKRTILRITVDIEKHARHQWSEGGRGFKREAWTERSLAPLVEAAAKFRYSPQEAQDEIFRPKIPGGPGRASVSASAGGAS